jgi:hypothetical protein
VNSHFAKNWGSARFADISDLWYVDEFVVCAETQQPLLPDEAEKCEVSNKLVVPELLLRCAVTGKKVLPSLLEKSAVTGKMALKNFFVSSSISGARALRRREHRIDDWKALSQTGSKTMCMERQEVSSRWFKDMPTHARSRSRWVYDNKRGITAGTTTWSFEWPSEKNWQARVVANYRCELVSNTRWPITRWNGDLISKRWAFGSLSGNKELARTENSAIRFVICNSRWWSDWENRDRQTGQ